MCKYASCDCDACIFYIVYTYKLHSKYEYFRFICCYLGFFGDFVNILSVSCVLKAVNKGCSVHEWIGLCIIYTVALRLDLLDLLS